MDPSRPSRRSAPDSAVARGHTPERLWRLRSCSWLALTVSRALGAGLFLLLVVDCAHAQPGEATFAGTWDTDYGRLLLEQNGSQVTGTYTYGSGGTLVGSVEGQRLTFRYQEASVAGEGWFDLEASGQAFAGSWREEGSDRWQPWGGRRPRGAVDRTAGAGGFSGLYETNFGRLRLTQNGVRVSGYYAYGAGGTIDGTVSEGRLTFAYKEPVAHGEGWFELDDSGGLVGQWRASGSSDWGAWSGPRVAPEGGTVWLIVLEPQWEASLSDPEYSFGEMLRVFFEGRVGHVKVRQRRLQSGADFARVAAEVSLIAEPVALWLSGHGSPQGFQVAGATIGAEEIVPVLEAAPNVFVLHFAACAAMAGDLAQRIRRALPEDRDLAISGYAESVDWGASATFEMLYLELVLSRGMTPGRAAEVLRSEIGYADDLATNGSPLAPLGFQLVE